MRLFQTCLAVVMSLQCAMAAAATGSVVTVLKDGASFRAEFTNAATAPNVTCDGTQLVCDNAYRFYTSEGTVGAQGLETDNLLLDTTPAHWVPFVKTGPVATRLLVQTSVDPGTGAPCYDVALQVPPLSDTEKIHLFFLNSPASDSPPAAVKSLWTYERGAVGCRLCVQRTIFNTLNARKWGAHAFTLFSRKEFLKPCNDGSFAAHELEVVYTRETLTTLCTIFATPEGSFGKFLPVLGHVGAPDFLAEWLSAALTPGFSTGAGAGNRWIEHFLKLGETGLKLQPQGCPCTAHTAGACWLLQCEELPPPPGDPECPPCCCPCPCPCPCDGPPPGAPPTFCPKTKGFWKNHPEEWPIEAVALGDEAYTKVQAIALLNTPTGGDASLILAHQMIAAKLNKAKGADAAVIAALLLTGDLLLTPQAGNLPYGTLPASAVGQQMILVATVLDAYNNGQLGNCEE